MGASKESKSKSHERIVEVAAQRIRESGTESPGVAEIMSAAGLTHGGFYKHFSSREELIEQALRRALSDGEEAMGEIAGQAEDPLGAFVDWYLSAEHRDGPGSGCGVACLGSDVSRGSERLRDAYGAQVERYIEQFAALLGGGPGSRRQAELAVSSLVGALVLARGVADQELSGEILETVRDGVKGLGAAASA